MKKKNKKKNNDLKLGLQKLTDFTSQSINKVYKNFKKKQKIQEKNELKLREEMVKKEQKKIELKIKEQSKRDNEIKKKKMSLNQENKNLNRKIKNN